MRQQTLVCRHEIPSTEFVELKQMICVTLVFAALRIAFD